MHSTFSGAGPGRGGSPFPSSHSPSLLAAAAGGGTPAPPVDAHEGPVVNRDGAPMLLLGKCNALSLSPEGDAVVAGGDRLLSVVPLDEETFERPRNMLTGSVDQPTIIDVQWCPGNAAFVAAATSKGKIIVCDNSAFSRVGHHMPPRILSDPNTSRKTNRLCWDTEGMAILSGGQDNVIKLWDPATGAVRERFKGNSAVRDVQFHPRQPHVFAASFDKGAIQIWDSRSSRTKPAHELTTIPAVPVLTIDWHPTEDHALASGGRDKMIKVWNTSSAKSPTHEIQTGFALSRVKWHPSRANLLGSCFSGLETSVSIWDIDNSYVPVRSCIGHQNSVVTGFVWLEQPQSQFIPAAYSSGAFSPRHADSATAPTPRPARHPPDLRRHHRRRREGLISCSHDGRLIWHTHAHGSVSPRALMNPVTLDWSTRGELAFTCIKDDPEDTSLLLPLAPPPPPEVAEPISRVRSPRFSSIGSIGGLTTDDSEGKMPPPPVRVASLSAAPGARSAASSTSSSSLAASKMPPSTTLTGDAFRRFASKGGGVSSNIRNSLSMTSMSTAFASATGGGAGVGSDRAAPGAGAGRAASPATSTAGSGSPLKTPTAHPANLSRRSVTAPTPPPGGMRRPIPSRNTVSLNKTVSDAGGGRSEGYSGSSLSTLSSSFGIQGGSSMDSKSSSSGVSSPVKSSASKLRPPPLKVPLAAPPAAAGAAIDTSRVAATPAHLSAAAAAASSPSPRAAPAAAKGGEKRHDYANDFDIIHIVKPGRHNPFAGCESMEDCDEDFDAFERFARNYVLSGRSVSEMCGHNRKVAAEERRPLISAIWRVVARCARTLRAERRRAEMARVAVPHYLSPVERANGDRSPTNSMSTMSLPASPSSSASSPSASPARRRPRSPGEGVGVGIDVGWSASSIADTPRRKHVGAGFDTPDLPSVDFPPEFESEESDDTDEGEGEEPPGTRSSAIPPPLDAAAASFAAEREAAGAGGKKRGTRAQRRGKAADQAAAAASALDAAFPVFGCSDVFRRSPPMRAVAPRSDDGGASSSDGSDSDLGDGERDFRLIGSMLAEFGASHSLYKGDFERDPDARHYPRFQQGHAAGLSHIPPFDLNEPFASGAALRPPRPPRRQQRQRPPYRADRDRDSATHASSRSPPTGPLPERGRPSVTSAGAASIRSLSRDTDDAPARTAGGADEEQSLPIMSALRSGRSGGGGGAHLPNVRSDPSLVSLKKHRTSPFGAALAAGSSSAARQTLHSASASFSPPRRPNTGVAQSDEALSLRRADLSRSQQLSAASTTAGGTESRRPRREHPPAPAAADAPEAATTTNGTAAAASASSPLSIYDALGGGGSGRRPRDDDSDEDESAYDRKSSTTSSDSGGGGGRSENFGYDDSLRSLEDLASAESRMSGLAFDDPFGDFPLPLSAAHTRGSLPPAVYSFVSAKGLADAAACQRTLEELLDFLIDYGDVQNASAVLLVLGDLFEFDHRTRLEVLRAYIDNLQNLEMFVQATHVVLVSREEVLEGLRPHSAFVSASCVVCLTPFPNNSPVCAKCNAATGICYICSAPVRSYYTWCVDCGHGGHASHLDAHFRAQAECPKPDCGHRCRGSGAAAATGGGGDEPA